MSDHSAALANLERAFGELESYLALPVQTKRDKAGIIQAFEFTFELFWKTFQKLAPEAGLEAASPREALQAGLKLHFIEAPDAGHWVQMLADRNLTSHLYREEVADQVFDRVCGAYVRCFRTALAQLRAEVATRA